MVLVITEGPDCRHERHLYQKIPRWKFYRVLNLAALQEVVDELATVFHTCCRGCIFLFNREFQHIEPGGHSLATIAGHRRDWCSGQNDLKVGDGGADGLLKGLRPAFGTVTESVHPD